MVEKKVTEQRMEKQEIRNKEGVKNKKMKQKEKRWTKFCLTVKNHDF